MLYRLYEILVRKECTGTHVFYGFARHRRRDAPPFRPHPPPLCVRHGGGCDSFKSMLLNDLVSGAAGWALGVSPAGVQHAPHPRVENICEHSQHEFRKFLEGWMTGRCGEGARPPHTKCGGRPRPFFLSGQFCRDHHVPASAAPRPPPLTRVPPRDHRVKNST